MVEALAWPGVGLILGLVALTVFRRPVIKKLESLSLASKDGLKFDRQQEPDAAKTEVLPTLTPDPKPSALSEAKVAPDQAGMTFEQLMNQPVTATVLQREKYASEQFAKFPLNDDRERMTALMRALVSCNVELEFTRASHLIYGSQLNLLVTLAGGHGGITTSRAQQAFVDAKARYPDLHKERTFDLWLRYLAETGFIVATGEKIDITQYGTDFLKFIVDHRLAHDRIG